MKKLKTFSNSSHRWKTWRAGPDRHLERSSGGTERGTVLLQVLFFSILGVLLSSLLVSGLFMQSHAMRRGRDAPQLFYSAESGVHYTIQHLVNAVSREDGAIEQFRVLAALWNRPEPLTGTVGQVPYEARIVDVSPNLAFRAFVRKYADVTIEAETHKSGVPAQVIRATYRLRLGPMATEGQRRATRLVWQRS